MYSLSPTYPFQEATASPKKEWRKEKIKQERRCNIQGIGGLSRKRAGRWGRRKEDPRTARHQAWRGASADPSRRRRGRHRKGPERGGETSDPPGASDPVERAFTML